jgi:hypothetical protein
MLTFRQHEDLFGKAFSMYLLEAYLRIFLLHLYMYCPTLILESMD